MAARIPAHCPHCGLIFTPGAISLGPNVTVTMTNNKTNCPRCGEWANLLDGVFRMTGDALELISGPQFTADVLRQFADLLSRARAEGTDLKTLKSEAERIDPDLGKVVETLRAQTPSLWIVVVLLLLTAIRSCDFKVNIEADVDINELVDQISGETVLCNAIKSGLSSRASRFIDLTGPE